MEYKDFRKMLETKAMSSIDRRQFEQYARELYDGIGAGKLSEEHVASHVRAFESGNRWGIYSMSSLLAGCVKEGTIEAHPKGLRKIPLQRP